MDKHQKKLAQLKAEQRAQTARDAHLRNLIDSNKSNLEDKLAVFKTLIHVDQQRFSMALSKMLGENGKTDKSV